MSLYFTEFAGLGRMAVSGVIAGAAGAMQCAGGPIVSGSITLSGSNQQSVAFNGETRLLRVSASVAAWIAIGASPDATTTMLRIHMPAGSVEYFAVEPGHKIAGITA